MVSVGPGQHRRDRAGRRSRRNGRRGHVAPGRSLVRHADERSPDNIAPIVAYLASEQSGWINGRIVHTTGYEVALYNNPEPLIRLIGTAPWDVDALADQVERSFGPMLGRQG